MTFRISHVCLLLSGFVTGIALTSSVSGELVFVTYNNLDMFSSGPAARGTVAAIVAVFVAARVRSRRNLSVASFAGLALLGFTLSGGSWPFETYVGGLGAGLLLGGLVGLCATADRTWLQTALAAGVVAGLLLAEPVGHVRTWSSTPRRYADYVPGSAYEPDLAALTVLALTAVVLAAALASGDFGDPTDLAVSGRALVAGIGLPLVGLALYWWFVRRVWNLGVGGAMQGRWLFGIVLVVVVIAAALWLEGRTGVLLLAAMAFVAVGGGSLSSYPDPWPWLLVPAALVLAGAALGRRFPQPLFGIGALVLVAASAVFEHPPWDDVHLGATWFLLPFAATYTFASSVPASEPVTAASLAAPAALSVPLVVDFGWTAYAPLTQSRVPSWPDSWVSTGVSVSAVLACGVAVAYLRTRSP
ncbi:hypothetical protein [Rhodococcus opacus]|nr:hypothetical protein [Rhodococcus opacus]